MSRPDPGQARAGRREWTGLGVLALPCLLYSMDLTVLNLAIPHISADLRPTQSQMLWIVDIYGFLLAGLLIPMGTLGDRIGRRRLLLAGAAAFGLASVLAAFASTPALLIGARALLGVAAATLAPSTLSLIRNMFTDPRERTFAIGVWISSFSAGGAIGPVIGGVLLEYFWWGSVFLLAVPVMIALLAVGPVLLPEFRDPQPGRMDLASALLSLATVLAVIYGFKHVAEHGPGWPAAAAIAAGVAVGAVFLRRQHRLDDPLIDPALFRRPGFAAALAVNVLALFTAFGFFLLIAQYLQLVLGMSPLQAGLWMAPSGAAFIIGSMAAPALVRRRHPATVITVGFIVSAAGFALLALAGDGGRPAVLMAGYLLFCLGLAPIGTLTTDMVVGLAPPQRAGAASGLSETSFEFGGALGIAVLGSVSSFTYRRLAADPIAEAGLPASAADTLAATMAQAAQMPPAISAGLAQAARAAYGQAFVLTAVICALVAVAAAAIAWRLLRSLPAPAAGLH